MIYPGVAIKPANTTRNPLDQGVSRHAISKTAMLYSLGIFRCRRKMPSEHYIELLEWGAGEALLQKKVSPALSLLLRRLGHA